MILIADASALIALAICDQLSLPEQLYGRVHVPESVYNECATPGKPHSEALAVFLKDKILPISGDLPLSTGFSLGQGETDAMRLYLEHSADVLLIDDKRARKIAAKNGIHCIGSLGLFISAHRKGLDVSLQESVQKLRDSDLFLADALLDEVLKIAGQTPS